MGKSHCKSATACYSQKFEFICDIASNWLGGVCWPCESACHMLLTAADPLILSLTANLCAKPGYLSLARDRLETACGLEGRIMR
jgi:hypothetical protein